MPKILTHSYNELLSIIAHCSKNPKPNIIFLFPTVTFSISFFIFLFFLLSPFSLSSSLFLVASVSIYFTIWAPPLQGSSVGNLKAQMPLDTKSTSPSKCCLRYGGRAWQRGDLILWVWVHRSQTDMGIGVEGRLAWVIELTIMGVWSTWWSLELWWLVAGDFTRLRPSRFTCCLTRRYGSGHKRWHWCAFALSPWLFFLFLFRMLVVMKLWVWVCDLVGCFSLSFSGCWWW